MASLMTVEVDAVLDGVEGRVDAGVLHLGVVRAVGLELAASGS